VSEIDLDAKTWTLPTARAKNNRQHCDSAIGASDRHNRTIFEFEIPQFGDFNLGIFEPVSFSRAKELLDAEVGTSLPAWTLHDLRRTAASGMAGLASRRT
jgi:hypothetical protein